MKQDGPQKEQELLKPEVAKALIDDASPISRTMTRTFLRGLFAGLEGTDTKIKGSLDFRFRLFRSRRIREAELCGGSFNLVRFRCHTFVRQSQIRPAQEIPREHRATEIQVPHWDPNYTHRANVGGLRGAYLLSEGVFVEPLKQPLPEDLRDIVWIDRETTVLVPVFLDEPFLSTSLLAELEMTDPRKKERRTRSVKNTDLTLPYLNLAECEIMDDVLHYALSSNPPMARDYISSPDTDILEIAPCFFCSKPAGYRETSKDGYLAPEHYSYPLVASVDSLSMIICAPVKGEKNSCHRKARKMLVELHRLAAPPPFEPEIVACSNPMCEHKFDWLDPKKASQPVSNIKLMRCSACKTAQYCSVKCQKEHWETHKGQCVVQRKG